MLLAKHVFFPSAALFAAISPWLLVMSLSGKYGLMIDPSTHAKSMLFGYVGALIAGYLTGKLKPAVLSLLFGLWLAGRLAELFTSQLILINLCYSVFGVVLSILVAPKFMSAKKWQNFLIGPVIAAIGCFPLMYWLLNLWVFPIDLPLHSYILLISLLMFFMGGRFITSLINKAFAELGHKAPQRVQPGIEGLAMIILALASLISLSATYYQWASIFSGVAGVLIMVRIYRWKLFTLDWRLIDIWSLGIGYVWLGIGLLVFSVALITEKSIASSLHVITIGALGTLSATVMTRVFSKHNKPPLTVYYLIVVLIGLATIFRVLTGFIPDYWHQLLGLSALAWSLCFICIFVFTLGCLINKQSD